MHNNLFKYSNNRKNKEGGVTLSAGGDQPADREGQVAGGQIGKGKVFGVQIRVGRIEEVE
jgi:hypothetical protein